MSSTRDALPSNLPPPLSPTFRAAQNESERASYAHPTPQQSSKNNKTYPPHLQQLPQSARTQAGRQGRSNDNTPLKKTPVRNYAASIALHVEPVPSPEITSDQTRSTDSKSQACLCRPGHKTRDRPGRPREGRGHASQPMGTRPFRSSAPRPRGLWAKASGLPFALFLIHKSRRAFRPPQ